ncbi:MAG: hypothetical protein NXH79_02735 [Rhodobacteraceae bacterium]|nr:hypothetical protein [Paracoccaceae bacterium]
MLGKLLFLCDRSETARLIRRIGTPQLTISDLMGLLNALEHRRREMSFSQLWEVWHRSEAALTSNLQSEQKELLERLMRTARFETQTRGRE